MDRRDVRLLTGLAVLSMAWLVVHAATGLAEGLVMLAPALLLALPLLAGRYVGEDAIDRVRAARAAAPAPRRGRAPRASRPRPVLALVPRGGLLLASSLATRPPPVFG